MKSCIVSTYFLKSFSLMFLEYTYSDGEDVHTVVVIPEELAALVSKVYSLMC
jgi:hypothetical protein